MEAPIINPMVPCVHPIPGGVYPGRMIRVHGHVPAEAQRFSINFQCGPCTEPQDDIALHFEFRFNTNFVARNHFVCMEWGPEELDGKIPFSVGQTFEILFLFDSDSIKIAINSVHFCEFLHRIPPPRISHIAVAGDVDMQYIGFEGGVPVETMPLQQNSQQFQIPDDPPPSYNAATGYGAMQAVTTAPAPATAMTTTHDTALPQRNCSCCPQSLTVNCKQCTHNCDICLNNCGTFLNNCCTWLIRASNNAHWSCTCGLLMGGIAGVLISVFGITYLLIVAMGSGGVW